MKKRKFSKSSSEGKQTRIGKKVGNVVVIMQMISVVFAVGMCVIMFRSLATGMLEQRCTNGTNMLSYVLSQSGGAEDPNQLLDELKSRMGCEFTIFEGNTRAYTTVVQDGQRVVGTALSAELSEIVLQKGQNYVGKATILNEEYLCSYVPTRDASGAVNGLLFAGISSADANHQIFMTVIWSSLVSLGVIIVCIFFLTAYLKKTVSAPLAEITQVASRLEQGRLGLNGSGESGITVHSNDEVGQLARIFERTIHRLRSYIGEIASILDSIASGDLTASAQQAELLDKVLEDMENEELNAQLKATMEEKQAILGRLGALQQDEEQRAGQEARLRELAEWLKKQKSEFAEYDDSITRRYVERITVVDAETIRIKFRYTDVEIDRAVRT